MTNISRTYDSTTGQDLAHKMGQERSALESKQMGDLYLGSMPDLMSSISRIRDIQKYLSGYGADPRGLEVVPHTRLASTSMSGS